MPCRPEYRVVSWALVLTPRSIDGVMELRSDTPGETREIAAVVARLARSGDIVLLSGDMGSGKTVFAQGFGRALGVIEPMTSPTFTLVNSYPAGALTLHHGDLYRLERTGEVADLALGELAEFGGVLIVEWGEAAAGVVRDHLMVHFDTVIDEDDDDDGPSSTRLIDIAAVGSMWAQRMERLERDLGGYAC